MNDHHGKPPMKYAKNDAKAHARETMRAIWGTALNPFDEGLNLNEAGLRRRGMWRQGRDDHGDQLFGPARDISAPDTDDRRQAHGAGEILARTFGAGGGAHPSPDAGLTETEKAATSAAFQGCGLLL